MSIKNKLLAMIFAAALGLILLGGSSLYGISRTLESIQDIGGNRLPSVAALLHFQSAVTDLSRTLYQGAAIEQQPSLEEKRRELESAFKRRDDAAKRAQAAIAAYEALPTDSEEAALWQKAKQSWTEWYAFEQKLYALHQQVLQSPTPDNIRNLSETSVRTGQQRRALTAQLTTRLTELTTLNENAAGTSSRAAEVAAARTEQLQAGILLVLLSATALLGWITYRAIMRPLSLAETTVEEISASNDLTRRVGYQADDEIGRLVKALDAMLETIQRSMKSIQTNMAGVQSSASALTGAAAEVATGSATQSSAASAMAASIEELTVSISSVSGSADDAHRLAQSSAVAASAGNAIIDRTVAEMAAIDASVIRASDVISSLGEESQRISAVVQVIKEVADQTNLLALNAAIEAARAGEQGRGFAVVADEVRKLAERTTQSTQDIAGMIGAIQHSATQAVEEMQRVVERVSGGRELATEAGERIAEILDTANQVSHSITEISQALQEQSAASTDIAQHVESIAQMAEENHGASENTSDTASQVNQLADDVHRIIQRFRV